MLDSCRGNVTSLMCLLAAVHFAEPRSVPCSQAELTSIHSMTVNMATAAGTWAYMDRQAPPGRYDEKNEVYALGVLILEVRMPASCVMTV